jgi:type IV secretion system protein TrbL
VTTAPAAEHRWLLRRVLVGAGLAVLAVFTVIVGVVLGAVGGLPAPAAVATGQQVPPTAAASTGFTSGTPPGPSSVAFLDAASLRGELAAGPLAVHGVKLGCPGPDALCDLGAGAVDCATDPIECGNNAAEGAANVADGGVKGIGGLADDLTGPRGIGGLPGVPGVPGLGGCGLLDALCDKIPSLGDLPGLPRLPGLPGLPGMPGNTDLGKSIPGLGDIPNPFEELGDIIAKAAADAWTAAMLAIWNAGLFVLRIVLTFSELFLTPDLRADGPGRDVYSYTLWLALALAVILTIVQLGAAAFKRDGKGLARALIGAGQFVIVCAVWFGYCVTLVAACGALTKALMRPLLGVSTWPDWDPLGDLDVQDIADGTVATVLGLLGLVLWIAALGHLLVYLARAAALLVLTATGPLAAAGLVADAGRSWFWKSLRWFHAAALTPVVMVLVLGIGVQMAGGVAAHLADSTQKAIGTALPAVMLICISAVAPLALFKLLAFVDPGTPSGASFRQGLAMQGGIQGLLTGGSTGGGGGGASAASTADSNGRSAGEQGAEDSTSSRFNGATKGFLGGLGVAGQGLTAGMGIVQTIGAKGTSLMADETNQTGIGHHTYGPDFSGARSSNGQRGGQNGTHPSQQNQDNGSDGDSDDGPDVPPPPMPPGPMPPTPQTLPTTQPPTAQSGGGSNGQGAAPKPAGAGGTGGGAGGAGAAAAGATPPPVV